MAQIDIIFRLYVPVLHVFTLCIGVYCMHLLYVCTLYMYCMYCPFTVRVIGVTHNISRKSKIRTVTLSLMITITKVFDTCVFLFSGNVCSWHLAFVARLHLLKVRSTKAIATQNAPC